MQMTCLSSHSDIACAHSDCVQSRSLVLEMILCFAPGLNFVKSYQPFRIDPRLTDENATVNFSGCKWNASESLSAIKEGTLIFY